MKKRTIEYINNGGSTRTFDISRKACHRFGYYHGDRILVPHGINKEATVIGVYDRCLWVHIDGYDGATYASYQHKAEYEKMGYRLIKRAGTVKGDK